MKKDVVAKGHTLIDALTNVVQKPEVKENVPFRMPISGLLKIPGIGDVITGRVEQGTVNKGDLLKIAPRNVSGKCFSIEMHHRQVESAKAGDNVGINVNGLVKDNMPKSGDIIYLEKDPNSNGREPSAVQQFKAMVFIQDHPGELQSAKLNDKGERSMGGFTPSIHIRTSRAACRLVQIHWKKGKSTNGAQVDDPAFLKAGDQALVTMEPKAETPLFVDTFGNCPGLGRFAGMDSNTLIMLGKVTEVTYKQE